VGAAILEAVLIDNVLVSLNVLTDVGDVPSERREERIDELLARVGLSIEPVALTPEA
jgi:hypothetical protein